MWEHHTDYDYVPEDLIDRVNKRADEGWEVVQFIERASYTDREGNAILPHLIVIMKRLKRPSMHRYDTRIPVAEVAQQEAPA